MAHGGEPISDGSEAGVPAGSNTTNDTGDLASGQQNLSEGAIQQGLDETKTKDSDADSENAAGKTVNSPLTGQGQKINWETFKLEEERLKTFQNWTASFVDKEKLALAGFVFYWGSDIVKCVFCKTEIGHWMKGDDPFEEHKKWSPNCPFLSGYDVGNVPIDEERLPVKPLKKRSCDTCGLYGVNVRPSGKRSGCEPVDGLSSTMERLGILYSSKPSYPEYVILDARLKTFKNWPVAMKQDPEKLSEAGFFYTSNGDSTICFHCGNGLRYWEDYDDPWIQHAIWFPRCGFLVMSKGKPFVDHVLQNKEKISTPEGQAEVAKELEIPSTRKDDAPKPPEKEGNVRLCKICGKNERSIVFLPCGHVLACMECGPEHSVCPDCNVEISAKMKAHIA